MTSTSYINYKDSHFEHPVLTAIRGEPTYETLNHIKKELKANTRSVPTTLGGGNHGYLGMILTTAEYCRIAPTDPFTRPPNPGVLVPTPRQNCKRRKHASFNQKLYLDTLLLERTFIKKSSRQLTTNISLPFATPSPDK